MARLIDDEPTQLLPIAALRSPPLPTFDDPAPFAADEKTEVTSMPPGAFEHDALAVTVAPAPPSRKLGRALGVGAVVVASLAAVVSIVALRGKHEGAASSVAAPPPPVVAAVIETAVAEPVRAAPVVAKSAPVERASGEASAPAAIVEEPIAALPAVPRSVRSGVSKSTKRDHAVAKAKPEATRAAADAEAAASEPGRVTVVCDPACDAVLIAGKNAGPSPARATVAAGAVPIVLRAGSLVRSVSIDVAPGEARSVRARMSR